MRKFLPVVALLAASGCGYEEQPLPPLANIPGPVIGLSATQLDSELVVRFSPPSLTTEAIPIHSVLELDVRVGPGGEHFDEQTWAANARKLAGGTTKDGIFQYETNVTVWADREVTVGARAIGSNGKPSIWSFATVPIVASPQPPANIKVENTAAGVRLEWNGLGSAFRIYRKTGDGEFLQIADAEKSPWTDSTSQFGQKYEYKLQSVVKLPDNHEATSQFSPAVIITPEDKFPPATPSGLQVTATPNSFELSWNGNGEPDFAGYRVYRSAGGGPFEKVAEVQLPAFSDKQVQQGREYRYEVSAVDRLGNESPRSQPVEGRLQ
jgi:hypothetical protein